MRLSTRVLKAVPIAVSAGLVLAACGSDGSSNEAIQQPEAVAAEAGAAAPADTAKETAATAPEAVSEAAEAPAAGVAKSPATKLTAGKVVKKAAAANSDAAARATEKAAASSSATAGKAESGSKAPAKSMLNNLERMKSQESAAQQAANAKIAANKNGATDVGITRTSIKLGSVSMHGMPLGNVLVAPQVRANLAAANMINDRGGVLGRRLTITDCDDGPGEVSRAKACIKKLVNQDRIFSLITGIDWATASIHDDLKQHKLPYVGAWAYSQTEWMDPYMFPTHTSMLHEARAGAHWAGKVVKPKTYGLVCLTSPEMQISCNIVTEVLEKYGAKMVKRVNVSISETSMSAQVLAMRAANPDHIIHYVINPATMAKFFVESAQQNFWPNKGVSGNHMATEIIGSIFGKHPVNRYWTNTTYKLWGTEYMAAMAKYAVGNVGLNNHVGQAGYVGVNMFAQAAKLVGPNLTRERLMATLGNGTVWYSDASLDQKFMYTKSERLEGLAGSKGIFTNQDYAQGREFMYKYTSSNTVSDPSGSPSGFAPDPDMFVIHTNP